MIVNDNFGVSFDFGLLDSFLYRIGRYFSKFGPVVNRKEGKILPDSAGGLAVPMSCQVVGLCSWVMAWVECVEVQCWLCCAGLADTTLLPAEHFSKKFPLSFQSESSSEVSSVFCGGTYTCVLQNVVLFLLLSSMVCCHSFQNVSCTEILVCRHS